MFKTTPPTQEMSSDEMKSDLLSSLEDLKNRETAIKEQEIVNKDTIKQIRARAIQSLFAILEDFGVDASNLESINAFLSKLREQSPDLADLFEIAFTDLTNETENEQKQAQVANESEFNNAGTMNKFRNLGPETLRPS
jgi:hypothetical protein